MGKKTYVTPMAVEEAFVANCYVAKCSVSVTSNGMRCVNPYHEHFGEEYFAGVWVTGANACSIIVTESSTKTSGSGYLPNNGATVYGLSGAMTADCSVTITETTTGGRPGKPGETVVDIPAGWEGYTSVGTYYLTCDAATNKASSACYGLYFNEGSAVKNVLS